MEKFAPDFPQAFALFLFTLLRLVRLGVKCGAALRFSG
jgi:hypothetical protein